MKLNEADLKKLEREIISATENAMDDTYNFYKKKTPIKSGNARRKTKYTKSSDRYKINSDYDYAERLDEGFSKQAPKGFTDPSFDYLEKQITSRFKRI